MDGRAGALSVFPSVRTVTAYPLLSITRGDGLMAQTEEKKPQNGTDEVPRRNPDLPPEVDWKTEPLPLHVNFATVASSDEEFSIVFGAVSPQGKTTADGRNFGTFVSSLRMSPGTFYRTLVVMIDIWNRWADNKRLPKFAPIHTKEGGS
jgi:hypothetical protein